MSNTRIHALTAAMPLFLLPVGVSVLPGCSVLGIVASAAERVPAAHKLRDVKTLVLVDDPNDRLPDPMLREVVARHVGYQLQQHGVLSQTIVDPDRLRDLADQLGDRYANTAMDALARHLDAEQVIHIQIETLLLRATNGLLNPNATVSVTVVDHTGQRLFPSPGPLHDPGDPTPGQRLAIEAGPPRYADTDRTAQATLTRELAEKIGLDVGRLFFKHQATKRGE